MAMFWARWYEPKVSSWEKARECLTEYCDEDTVRAEIGERKSVDVDQKPDDWVPGDRFPTAA